MSKELKKSQQIPEPAEQVEGEQKRRTKSSSPRVSQFILILAGIVGVLLLIVNDSVTVDRFVSEISSLDSTYSDLKIQNDSLQAELMRLSSAERITRIASQRLGFVYSSRTLEQIQVDKNKLEQAEKEDARDSTK
ncbi:MAG: FtsL-like putative cell division protein [Bacteroidetes bacterium]|nr:FtsL-like putative cell division protein [Bacteroidota bacterium]